MLKINKVINYVKISIYNFYLIFLFLLFFIKFNNNIIFLQEYTYVLHYYKHYIKNLTLIYYIIKFFIYFFIYFSFTFKICYYFDKLTFFINNKFFFY